MNNIPNIKIGIVAVSRDCFPESLAVNRRKAVIAAYEKKFGKDGIYECPICIVESEIHAQQALADVQKAGCNALCVYLGAINPVPSHWLKPAMTQPTPMPVTTTANSGRVILPSINSGKTGLAPSLKLEMHMWESKLAQAAIATSTTVLNASGNAKFVTIILPLL